MKNTFKINKGFIIERYIQEAITAGNKYQIKNNGNTEEAHYYAIYYLAKKAATYALEKMEGK